MAIGKGYQVRFEDNSAKFTADLKQKKMKITYAIGLKWLEICTKIITNKGIVDTGRLRASLSFITPYASASNPPVAESESKDKLRGKAGNNTIIVGSNLKYASRQELGNKKGSFLEPSISNYREDYKNVVEAILRE